MKNSIRVERKKRKITQAELAKNLNVSRQTIYSLEIGKFSPSSTLALKIAKFFDAKISDIFVLESSDLK